MIRARRPHILDKIEAHLPHAMATSAELNRLRWRCRRGMLENDLILARFLDARGAGLAADEIAALYRLLELSDNELWDLLAGRQQPADAAVAPLLEALRAVRAGEDAPPPDASRSASAWE